MRTVTVDIINEGALNLLKELELMKLIRLHLGKDESEEKPKSKLSDFSGILSQEDYQALKKHADQARKEWI